MKELLMGCGSNSEKKICLDSVGWHDLTRLDNNPAHNPDVVWDLTVHPLPFADETFDEIHAYQVLEHLANQGDYEFFFQRIYGVRKDTQAGRNVLCFGACWQVGMGRSFP